MQCLPSASGNPGNPSLDDFTCRQQRQSMLLSNCPLLLFAPSSKLPTRSKLPSSWRRLEKPTRDCKYENLKLYYLLTFKPLETLERSGMGQHSHLEWTVQRSDCQDPARRSDDLHVCTRNVSSCCHAQVRHWSFQRIMMSHMRWRGMYNIMACAQSITHSFKHCSFLLLICACMRQRGYSEPGSEPPDSTDLEPFRVRAPRASVGATVATWVPGVASEECLLGGQLRETHATLATTQRGRTPSPNDH